MSASLKMLGPGFSLSVNATPTLRETAGRSHFYHNNGELIAADPSQPPVLLKNMPHPHCRFFQDLVAAGVAVGVIDLLEIVHVDDK